MSEYPRETRELVRFSAVTVNGESVSDFTWQLTEQSERPTGTWSAPVDDDGTLALQLTPVTRRMTQDVWVRIVKGSQSIVAHAGKVERT